MVSLPTAGQKMVYQLKSFQRERLDTLDQQCATEKSEQGGAS